MNKLNSTFRYLLIGHVLSILSYLLALCVSIGFLFLSLNTSYKSYSRSMPPAFMIGIFGAMVVLFLFFFILHVYGIINLKKQTSGNWTFQIILIALGITAVITTIPYFLALVNLTDPEVKKYFDNKQKQ